MNRGEFKLRVWDDGATLEWQPAVVVRTRTDGSTVDYQPDTVHIVCNDGNAWRIAATTSGAVFGKRLAAIGRDWPGYPAMGGVMRLHPIMGRELAVLMYALSESIGNRARHMNAWMDATPERRADLWSIMAPDAMVADALDGRYLVCEWSRRLEAVCDGLTGRLVEPQDA